MPMLSINSPGPTPTPLDVDNGRACGSIAGGTLKTRNDQGMDRTKLSPDLNHAPVIWDRKILIFVTIVKHNDAQRLLKEEKFCIIGAL